jgi:hypothetical protein
VNVAVTGGNAHQQKLIQHAVDLTNQRHLRIKRWDHTWEVSVLPPDQVDTTAHDKFNTFMVTLGTSDAPTHIRNDMPFSGQGPFSGDLFFIESVVHELGHHLFQFIPTENQAQIVHMFGAKSGLEFAAVDRSWYDRPVEGMAETFKDSFLAAQNRVYYNRTHEKLDIHEYPAFRALWDPEEEIQAT